MDEKIDSIPRIRGIIEVPGDKSISHRALILGAMARGRIPISNLSTGGDCTSSITCLRSLGVAIEKQGQTEFSVEGRGIFGFREPPTVLDAGNSGTTMRLLCGLLAGQSFHSVITGDDSLRQRPMRRVIRPLRQMGARISARDGGSTAPITIVGSSLTPIDYSMPVASAQVKSAILIAGLFCHGETTVREKVRSRDHTERMLRHMGADIRVADGTIVVKGGDELTTEGIFVPGDISSAAYFILAATLLRDSCLEIANVGLNPGRVGFIEALMHMGAEISTNNIRTQNEEPFGTIKVRSSALRATEVTPEMIPTMVDEVPALALAATQAVGKTSITGAGELRFKESDRLKNIATELNRLGGRVTEREDGLEIEGPTELAGTTCPTYGDHRLALTLAVAGLIAKGQTVLAGAEVVDISFPGFFQKLRQLRSDRDA
jgi:3-phosphoshikimate 1-carboxyvinyltransferase